MVVFIGIKIGDLSPVDYTAHSDSVLKKLDHVIEKLDNTETHIKKLEDHIERLETQLSATVTPAVLQDPKTLKPTKKKVNNLFAIKTLSLTTAIGQSTQVRSGNLKFKVLRFGMIGTTMVLRVVQ